MRVFYVFDDFYSEGPVWLNVLWPHYRALKEGVDTVYIPRTATKRNPSPLQRRLPRKLIYSRFQRDLHEKIITNLDPSVPNVLIVLALNYRDIDWTTHLHPVWSAFSHTVLCLSDAFNVDYLSPKVIEKFDLVTSYCEDLRSELVAAFDVPTLFLPSHTDVFNYHCTSAYRPIDLFLVGRRDQNLHPHLHQHFNSREGNRIFLDFVTRTQTPLSSANEFELLMTMYGRSLGAFCYESSKLPRFQGRSPMTARWVHAWASGCTVFGTNPRGAGVERLINWPESVIELPDDPTAAIAKIEQTLIDEERLARRRRRNVSEALLRHDSRYRYRDIFRALSLPLPERMRTAIDLMGEMARCISGVSHDEGG